MRRTEPANQATADRDRKKVGCAGEDRHSAVRSIFLVAYLAMGSAATAGPQENGSAPPEPEATPPNILWITAEDLSPSLGCYGDPDARTPNLDQFAARAVRYDRAFATAPVCSPARSCLITGMYATSLGTQRLRSQFPLPESVRGFPALLRQAGYFTTNQVKTDYNMAEEQAFIRDCWDRQGATADWRERPTPDTPFFSVINLMVTHQSRTSVWSQDEFEAQVGSKLSAAERHQPQDMHLPPYYPDIPSARATMARYHDCVTVLDAEVQAILDRLEADHLTESTIVFFYGDHGMGLPRGKRLLHDTGLRVPLLIRFPEAFGKFAPGEPGSRSGRLVSFVDFAPTVLSLAGLDVPGRMQGVPFLGDGAGRPRSHVFGARDRVDEAIDLSRSVRDDRYLYIRNYMPHRSWMPPEAYSDASTLRQELKRMRAEGTLDPLSLTYAAPRKAIEELYDTRNDPDQMNNLARSAAHQEILDRHRAALGAWCRETRDLGFLPESDAWRRLRDSQAQALRSISRDEAAHPLDRILAVADVVGRPGTVAISVQALDDPDPAVRYWGVVGLEAARDEQATREEALKRCLADASPPVRIEAAAALAAMRGDQAAIDVLLESMNGDVAEDVLHAMRGLELAGHAAQAHAEAVEALRQRAVAAQETPGASPCWQFVQFSAEAALEAGEDHAALMPGTTPAAPASSPSGSAKWEPDIAAFEEADLATPPPSGGVLFVGSSSIRRWESVAQDFPDEQVLNRGFGGSQLRDVLAYADRIILPYAPRLIVLYEGDNDLAQDRTPEQIRDDLNALMSLLKSRGCEARVLFLAIKPSPKRWSLVDRAREANSLIAALAQDDPQLEFVDIFDAMLGEDGLPRGELYAEDGLHLSPAGYQIWAERLRPLLP